MTTTLTASSQQPNQPAATTNTAQAAKVPSAHKLVTRAKTGAADDLQLQAWLKDSTKASGVPPHVQDATVIAKLQALVSSARRSQQSLARISTRANPSSPHGKDKQSPSVQAA
jgi:hypothetical protein